MGSGLSDKQLLHEVRNLTTLLQAQFQGLRKHEKSGKVDSNATELIENMEQTLGFLKKILSVHQTPIRSGETLLNEVLLYLHKMTGIWKQHGIDWILRLPPQIIFISILREDLMQILYGLCLNSVQALKQKGNLEVYTEFIPLCEGANTGELQIHIVDSGPGLPPQVLEYLSNPHAPEPSIQDNHGIGLTIVKKLWSQCNVKTQIQTNSYGTRIIMSLQGRRCCDSIKIVPGKPLILFVDDEPQILRMCGKAIQKMGYGYLLANDVESASYFINCYKDSLNLILTDYSLRNHTPENFLNELKRKQIEIPVILMTGEPHHTLAIHPTLKAILHKPFDLKDFSQCIEHFLYL
jgi:CheY-like chemotaxis protein